MWLLVLAVAILAALILWAFPGLWAYDVVLESGLESTMDNVMQFMADETRATAFALLVLLIIVFWWLARRTRLQ